MQNCIETLKDTSWILVCDVHKVSSDWSSTEPKGTVMSFSVDKMDESVWILLLNLSSTNGIPIRTHYLGYWRRMEHIVKKIIQQKSYKNAKSQNSVHSQKGSNQIKLGFAAICWCTFFNSVSLQSFMRKQWTNELKRSYFRNTSVLKI